MSKTSTFPLAELSDIEREVVDEVSRIITSELDIGQVYEQFASQVKRLVDFDRASINIIDERAGTFGAEYLSRKVGSLFGRGETAMLAGTVTGWVAKARRSMVVGDLADEVHTWTSEHLLRDGLRAMIAVPLVSKRRLIGVFTVLSRRPNAYGPREWRILERLAPHMAVAVENSLLFHEVKQLAWPWRALATPLYIPIPRVGYSSSTGLPRRCSDSVPAR